MNSANEAVASNDKDLEDKVDNPIWRTDEYGLTLLQEKRIEEAAHLPEIDWNFTPSRRSVVCIRHFEDHFVVREDSVVRLDGSVLTVKRDRVRLTAGAVPSVFDLKRRLPPRKTSFREETRKAKARSKSASRIKTVILLYYWDIG
ncbi:uncharacterized protein LOC124363761 [Homalodisca vitripennis]|uniref:uncharacterized protein LOC124363761 n=1 Tax=Homalodisca vitripennis TaxID=197043 RepID=UPI001EEA393D|nr:uncharacterized protein LOC124363761 [Homalodisca vitripennis]